MKKRTKKFKSYSIIALTSLTLLYSCGGDDDTSVIPEEPMASLEEMRIETTQTLTNGDIQTWRISNATLDTNGSTLDLTTNFNVMDDEFIFSGSAENGYLEWRPGDAINLQGITNQETLLDYYLSPINSSVIYNEDSSTSLTALNGDFTFDIVDETTITGVLKTSGRTSDGDLNITLTIKAALDYASIPANGLNFSLVNTFTTTNASLITGEASSGFIGSNSSNHLYIVSRDNSQSNSEGVRPEQILKYNLTTNTFEENLFFQNDFVTKRLNIINNELVVFGGLYANTYPLNPNGDATASFQHDLLITRFGFAAQDDFGYIIGGDLEAENIPSIIKKYNYLTNEIQDIATLPYSRFYGGSEIVNNKLYVFGGRANFNSNDINAECFTIDLNNNSISTFNMPEAPYVSYAEKQDNLIYVGYETRIDDGSGDYNNFDRVIKFGVYNTLNDTFTNISHNLDDSAQFTTIGGMTVVNNILYVLYGDVSTPETVSIYSAPI